MKETLGPVLILSVLIALVVVYVYDQLVAWVSAMFVLALIAAIFTGYGYVNGDPAFGLYMGGIMLFLAGVCLIPAFMNLPPKSQQAPPQ